MSISNEKQIVKQFGRRSRQAMCLVLAFLLALPVLAGGSTAHAASDTSSWTLVDNGGLIKDTSKDTSGTDLIAYNGELYVIWSEAGGTGTQMHAMKYNGTNWRSVDEIQPGCIPGGCLNTYADAIRVGNRAVSPSLAEYNGNLYTAWHEGYAGFNYQTRVRQFDGTNWKRVDGGTLNLTDQSATNPRMAVFNGELYAIWQEDSQIKVKKYNDTGGGWQVVSPASNLIGSGAGFPQLAVYDSSLYAVWREASSTVGVQQIKVIRYLGGSNWESIDDGGVRSDSGTYINNPSVTVFGSKMYVAWSDNDKAIRVKSYDAVNGWQWADNNAGLNYIASNSVSVPKLMVYDGGLYAAWVESNTIRAKKYDGSTWTTADSGQPINARIGSTVNSPSLAIYNGKLFSVWTEKYDNKYQIRVARMPVLQAPDAPLNVTAVAGDGEATVSFNPPASNGGSSITEYTVTSNPEGITGTGSGSSIKVTGLTNGESYTFSVTAKNAVGTSVASAPSNSVTPKSGFKLMVARDLNSPTGSAVDRNGNLYVVDEAESQVVKYGADGSLLSKWRNFGNNAQDSFSLPSGIAVSASGSVYVADREKARVYIFDASGNLTGVLGNDDELTTPRGVAVDKLGNVYVVDESKSQIIVFAADGLFKETWGNGPESNSGQFRDPMGVAVDDEGNVYVADTGNHVIQKWDAQGQFLKKWGSVGSTNGQFNRPGGVAVDEDGNVYVADTLNHRIQKFDSDGNYEDTWGNRGIDEGQFDFPYGVAVDGYGNVYAADTENHRIQILRKGPLLPTIKLQPSNTTAVNGSASFSVTATGTGLTYQWQVYSDEVEGFIDLSGATSPQLTLHNLSASHNGSRYRVVVSGSEQRVTSSEAKLTVDGIPAIPANNSVSANPATVTVSDTIKLTATGDRQAVMDGLVDGDERFVPVSWTSTEESKSGAFTWSAGDNGYVASYLTEKTDSYVVTATFQKQRWNGLGWVDIIGSTSTSTVNVTVNAATPVETAPTITGQPLNTTAVNGSASFSVTATGTDLTYQWQVDTGTGFHNIAGATSPALTLSNVVASMNGYSYRVVIVSGTQSTTSDAAKLTVNGNPNPGGESVPSTGTVTETVGSNADILVNGKAVSAGKATTAMVNNRKVTTIAVDEAKLKERLATGGDHAVVTIPVGGDSDVVIGELNGQMIKNMENGQAVLEIRTARATYTVPARQIDIDAIAKQIGASVGLQDIKVRILIAAAAANTVQLTEDAATKRGFKLIAPPVDYTITSSYGDTTVEIAKFNAYVERTIAIPDGVNPKEITTGIAVNPDGTVRHVPTKITVVDGKYYAQINSLTNSAYAVVWHPQAYSDMAGHWAQDMVNDMGSRMVIEGTGGDTFSPDRDITRAEFAAIVVRGLGLKLTNGATPFADVAASDWYAGAVNAAYAYGLIAGFEDGKFHPNDKITREQAMLIIAKAMAITGLKEKLPAQSEATLLQGYADSLAVSGWARRGAADSVQAGIVTGRNSTTLAPKAYMTRAEVATIVSRLLKQSGLI